jgi:hypothetical protein
LRSASVGGSFFGALAPESGNVWDNRERSQFAGPLGLSKLLFGPVLQLPA